MADTGSGQTNAPTSADILFITRKWSPAVGGMETYSLEMSQAFSDLGHVVDLKALRGNTDGGAPGVLKIVHFGMTTGLNLLAKRRSPDIAFGGDMAIWPLVRLACLSDTTLPVLTAHGTDVSFAARNSFLGRLYRWYIKAGRQMLPRNTIVVANSRATEKRVRALGFEKTLTVPLGCRVEVDKPIENLDRTLLFAGRLVRRKGLLWFVQHVLPHLPDDVRIAVAGTTWEKEESAALEDPRVDFLGALTQPALYSHMAGAMAVIIPNVRHGTHQFEGFGLIAAEAAAAGGIVFAAQLDGLETSVIDGVTGTLLPPQDADAWIDALNKLDQIPNDDRMKLREQAKQTAQEVFSWPRCARDTLAAIYSPK